ncbi:MAG: hypothetical protein DKINENOH_02859 [bacterium]|nr:hypothetical protein [bacterium]
MFIDEYGTKTRMNRSHARSAKGKRAHMSEALDPAVRLSVISALSLTGVGPTLTIEGSVDGQVFEDYVEHFLSRELTRDDIVMMDNIRFHYNQRILAKLRDLGARVEYLPAYSPDPNPLEECISKIKAIPRKKRSTTRKKLETALKQAINEVTKSDIAGWSR